MEPHLHLTVAWRALDRKWGKAIDLDTVEEMKKCIPAMVDNYTTTFSSEQYLHTIRRSRATLYHRSENRRSNRNVQRPDSFSNISITRIPSIDDLVSTNGTIDSGLEDMSFNEPHNDKDEKVLKKDPLSKERDEQSGLNLLKKFKLPTLYNVKKKLRRICSREKL